MSHKGYYFLETFGCQMNERDSLLGADLLEEAGYLPAASMEEADVVVINTCCVRQSAENRALGRIGSLKKRKEDHPELVIAVCGCLVQRPGALPGLAQKYRHVDLWLGTFAWPLLPAYVEAVRQGGQGCIDVAENDATQPAPAGAVKQETPYRAQVNVIHGCNNFCAYCIVPYVRGRERSRRPEAVLAEVRALAAQGCVEVQLLGQNVNSYGKDLSPQVSFAQLLQEVSRVEGLERVRFMTSHPRDFNQELLSVIAQEPRVCHHIHLPVQAGSDRILAAMNRGYTTAYYRDWVEEIRRQIPDCAITSDVMVGFPGETEAEFQETLAFLQKCRLDAVYSFLYSPRSGTPAAVLPQQVPEAVKKERLQRLMELENTISLEINRHYEGQTLPVLVEGPSKNTAEIWTGRTEQNKVVHFPPEGTAVGQIVPVVIEAAKTWTLNGRVQRRGEA